MKYIMNKLILILLWSAAVLLTSPAFVRSYCISEKESLAGADDADLSLIQGFDLDLFKIIFPKDLLKNFVFSPYSIWNALALAYFGSAGETQRQFEQVLRVPDKLWTYRIFRRLQFIYSERKDGNTFVLSNRAYFDESVRVQDCMTSLLHNEIQQLALMNDPTTSAKIINKFVSDKTRGHISQLVNPMDIMSAYMALVNAAYFKGKWLKPFNQSLTMDRTFTTFTKDTIDVPMMNQIGEFNSGVDQKNKFEYLELPYIGEKVAMYLFLPFYAGLEDFQRMVNSLTYESLEQYLKNMEQLGTHVVLPKFSIDTAIEDELIQAIYKMGLTDAFISTKANFTEFSYNRNLKLDRSIHKAFIEVNEEGTEAAAASVFISSKLGGSGFICDRPFVFMIRDKETQNILFMGAFKNPAEYSKVQKSTTQASRDQGASETKGDKRPNVVPPSEVLHSKTQDIPFESPQLLPSSNSRQPSGNINDRNNPRDSFNTPLRDISPIDQGGKNIEDFLRPPLPTDNIRVPLAGRPQIQNEESPFRRAFRYFSERVRSRENDRDD